MMGSSLNMDKYTWGWPVQLAEAFQDTCREHDNQFIRDVARFLGISPVDIRHRIFGSRGVNVSLTVENGAFFAGELCPVMCLKESLWIRCQEQCIVNGRCYEHRKSHGPFYTDARFLALPVRKPLRHEGVVYWVAEDGSAVNSEGALMPFQVDLKHRLVYIPNGPSGTLRAESSQTESGATESQPSSSCETEEDD